MNPLRIAFVGSGHVAKVHHQNLAQRNDVQLVGFCDVDTQRAEKAARQYEGAQGFGDAIAMYDNVKPDAVFVCVTPTAHGPIEVEAAKRGIHLFIEKPVTNDLATGQAIEAVIKESGIICSVGYMNRYRRSVERAKAILTGDPAILAMGFWIGGPYAVPWWGDKEKSGGQLVDQTTHTVDLIRYLIGEPVELYAEATRGFVTDLPGYNLDDASAVVMKTAGGALVNVLSCCANNPGYDVGLKIFCRNHTIDFSGWEHRLKVKKSHLESESIKGEENIFAKEVKAFVEAVRHNRPELIRSDYSDGLKSAALTLAATEAMETGKRIKLGE